MAEVSSLSVSPLTKVGWRRGLVNAPCGIMVSLMSDNSANGQPVRISESAVLDRREPGRTKGNKNALSDVKVIYCLKESECCTLIATVSKSVIWCFAPSQPLRLSQGVDCDTELIIMTLISTES